MLLKLNYYAITDILHTLLLKFTKAHNAYCILRLFHSTEMFVVSNVSRVVAESGLPYTIA